MKYSGLNKQNADLVKNMRAALKFAKDHPGIHYFNVGEKQTVDAIVALYELGLVKMEYTENEKSQMISGHFEIA